MRCNIEGRRVSLRSLTAITRGEMYPSALLFNEEWTFKYIFWHNSQTPRYLLLTYVSCPNVVKKQHILNKLVISSTGFESEIQGQCSQRPYQGVPTAETRNMSIAGTQKPQPSDTDLSIRWTKLAFVYTAYMLKDTYQLILRPNQTQLSLLMKSAVNKNKSKRLQHWPLGARSCSAEGWLNADYDCCPGDGQARHPVHWTIRNGWR